MKKFGITLLLIFWTIILLAQVPATIHFQGAIKDDKGEPVNDSQFMEFRIYDVESGSTALWIEQHYSVTITDGLFSVELGALTPFQSGLFDNPNLYVTFVFGGNEMAPRQKFTAVPYAIKAASSDEDWTISGNYVFNPSDSIGIGTATPKANIDIKGDIGIEPSPSEDHQADGITSMAVININSFGYGAALYMAPDGHYETASAGDESKLPCVALAVEDGIGNKKVLHYGYYRNDNWNWTIGGVIYLDVIEGQLTQIQPTGENNIVQVVGFATFNNRMMFNPSYLTSQNYLMNHNPAASFFANPNPAYQNSTIILDASSSSDPDPWDNIINYEWDFDGDGIYDFNTTNPVTQNDYVLSGTYNVKLRVTDNLGLQDETAQDIEVLECFLNCDDGIDCTMDSFDATTCTCIHTPDDNICSGLEDPCNSAYCDPTSGCVVIPLNGNTCDDGDPCTSNDVCSDGLCSGTPNNCDDGLSCTTDICNGDGSCTHTIVTGYCLIDGQCYIPGSNPVNFCEECDPSISQTTWSPLPNSVVCNAVDACTTEGNCDGFGNCIPGVPIDCDDSDPSTFDFCDPITGCYYVTNNAPVADFTAIPNPTNTGQNITFDASGSYDPDSGDYITTYDWDWDGDGTYDETTTNSIIIHQYAVAGYIDVKLRVIDSNGLDDEISNTIEIDCDPIGIPCGSSFSLGSVCGDDGNDYLSYQDCGNEYFEFLLDECDSDIISTVDLTAQIVLQTPGGINYDLYVYVTGCSLFDSSTNSSGQESINITIPDNFGSDDSIYLYVEVRMISGSSPGNWNLEIFGNTN